MRRPAYRLGWDRGHVDVLVGSFALSSFCILGGTTLYLLLGAQGGRLTLGLFPLALAGLLRVWGDSADSVAPCGPGEKLFVAFLGVFFLCAIAWGYGVPAYHYDGLLYHLPTAALAWQDRSLFVLTAHPQVGPNPVFAELPKVWAYAFSGDDSLATFQQLPNLLGLSALAFTVARSFGATATHSALAGVATLLVPKAMDQALSANVDLLAGLWGAICVDLLARRRDRPAAGALIAFAQLKYTTLLPATAGALLLFARFLRSRPAWALGWAALYFAFGGASEWRNLARYGNPVAPYQLLAGGRVANVVNRFAPRLAVRPADADPTKWTGYYIDGIEAAAAPGERPTELASHFEAWGDAFTTPYERNGGRWGPAWFVLAVPSLLVALALQLSRAIRLRRAPTMLLSLGFALVAYALTVKSWETRFGLLLVPFGFAAAAWALSVAWPSRWRAAPVVLASGLLAWCVIQIGLSHPRPALRANPALDAIELATRHTGGRAVDELARKLDELAPASLWIDFTFGERHEYGMPYTLLYPYFSRRWDRAVTIASSVMEASSLNRIRNAAPVALLLQPGSRLAAGDLAGLGYYRIWNNEAGEIYARP